MYLLKTIIAIIVLMLLMIVWKVPDFDAWEFWVGALLLGLYTSIVNHK